MLVELIAMIKREMIKKGKASYQQAANTVPLRAWPRHSGAVSRTYRQPQPCR